MKKIGNLIGGFNRMQNVPFSFQSQLIRYVLPCTLITVLPTSSVEVLGGGIQQGSVLVYIMQFGTMGEK
jgi:hypothetical protein